MFNMRFSSVSELRRWLEKKNYESGSGEAFSEWLTGFFENCNTISVRDEEYDFWACWELI